MSKYLKLLILPDLKSAVFLTVVFTLAICAGTLTALPEKIDVPGTDKWQHLVAFAALVYPITVASRRYWIPVTVFASCLAALIEIIQPYVNRFGDIKDFQADMLGVFLGLLIGILVRRLRVKRN
jgi:VanZ family protein